MDIFKYAEEFDADYYDQHTGYTYKVQDYNRAKRFGFPARMEVVESMTGKLVGYVDPPVKEG